jgi:chemotaxis protein MotB
VTVNVVGTGGASLILTDNMEQLKAQLEKTVSQVSNFDKLKDHIQMTVTSEGLRIELLEEQKDTFFDSGSTQLSANGRDMLVALARQLGTLPNKISVEGHTDAQPYTHGKDYTNWELSSDRANAARRLIQDSGLGKNQVTQVRGYADQNLRKPEAPFDPSNQRITLLVHYLSNESKPNIGGDETPPDHPDSAPPKH